MTLAAAAFLPDVMLMLKICSRLTRVMMIQQPTGTPIQDAFWISWMPTDQIMKLSCEAARHSRRADTGCSSHPHIYTDIHTCLPSLPVTDLLRVLAA